MANPNPSPETRFGAQGGNPINTAGRSSEEQKAWHEAAKLSANLRLRFLSSLQEKLEAGEDPLEYLKGDVLKLFKDSEDRAHGTPKSTVEGPGENGEHTMVTKIVREIVKAGDAEDS